VDYQKLNGCLNVCNDREGNSGKKMLWKYISAYMYWGGGAITRKDNIVILAKISTYVCGYQGIVVNNRHRSRHCADIGLWCADLTSVFTMLVILSHTYFALIINVTTGTIRVKGSPWLYRG
jgi:hypothetical protein